MVNVFPSFGAFNFVLEGINGVIICFVTLFQCFKCGENHKDAALSILPFYIYVKKAFCVVYGQTLLNALLVIKASAPTNTLFST